MNSTHPAVSVVLPVYNGGRYLHESITSVLGQTFKDFELLIWDDASTDDSWNIIKSFSDSRIVKRRQPANLGLFRNLNDAIKNARGDLVRLWCQDDKMKPCCLEREQEFWSKHPEAGMFYCNRDTIDARGAMVRPALHDDTPEVVGSKLADEISFNWGSMPGNLANVTLPKRVLDEMGLFNDMKLAADFEMWVRIQSRYPIGFCREPLIDLRSHKGQLSRSSGALLIFMRENQVIFEILERRLPAETKMLRQAYTPVARYVQYFHGGVKALLKGELGYAFEIFKQIQQWDNLLRVGGWWLVTGNLRWYRPAPVYTSNT